MATPPNIAMSYRLLGANYIQTAMNPKSSNSEKQKFEDSFNVSFSLFLPVEYLSYAT